MLWPNQQSLQEFAQQAANVSVSVLVSDYFAVIHTQLNSMVDGITEMARSTMNTLNNMNTLLANINATAVIDSNFIKYV